MMRCVCAYLCLLNYVCVLCNNLFSFSCIFRIYVHGILYLFPHVQNLVGSRQRNTMMKHRLGLIHHGSDLNPVQATDQERNPGERERDQPPQYVMVGRRTLQVHRYLCQILCIYVKHLPTEKSYKP
jgi:hypothetical protein